MIEGEWTSTVRRRALAQTTNTPAFEFTYEYQLPVSPFCLKVLNIDEAPIGSGKYKIEGDKLLSDAIAVNIRYIGKLTDTEDYGILLQKAIVSKLALELSYRLTSDKTLSNSLSIDYERALINGLSGDGQQGSKDTISTPDLTEVR